ncbi:MAG TPA: penicillin-binding transpeptidase domain-containing protein [Pyrinomonadaceae bacterium]|jgi:membrane peptidoglycan carboxypeptidase
MDLPEKQPALLSLVYTAGLGLMVLWLGVSLVRGMRHRRSGLAAVAPRDLPTEVRQRLGVTSTNRGLYWLRWLFVLLVLAVFGFHLYWAHYAEDRNERFQELNYKDLRNRRLAESTLRGWILDRSGKLENALALYTRTPDGQITRTYPLDREMAQLFGSDRGDAGLERALFGVQSEAAPEALDLALNHDVKQPANLDVRLTIDRDMQKTAVEQLRDRHGAVVVLNPQTGEVLAMYSNPSYTIEEVQDEANWIKLDANQRDRPLVNRALRAYYIPGSTFKTVVSIAAFLSGMETQQFTCSAAGYYAAPGSPPIYDSGGTGEVHGHIGIDTAYEVSCNQYFAQLAVKLGPERLKQAAQLIGIGTYDDPADTTRGRRRPDIWNASSPAVARALAPAEAAIVTNPKIRTYDLALEGFGQGYAGQMTTLQMAMVAATVANLEGKLMKPKIEFDLPPAVFNPVLRPDQAAQMRRIMGLVTQGPSGTATSVFAPITAQGILTGGKTGTAEKEVPVYDPKTGEPLKVKRYERDKRGNIIREYEEIVIDREKKRVDSWFLCIAPLDYPQLAIAVIIEGGGYGAKAAAPVAAALVLKARDLGLLAPPGTQPQQSQGQTQQRAQPSAPKQGQPAQTGATAPRPQPTPAAAQPRPKATPRAAPTRSP